MKFCQYCGEVVTYEFTPTRGAWYARNGRMCGVTEDGMPYPHSPVFDLITHKWVEFESKEEFEKYMAISEEDFGE